MARLFLAIDLPDAVRQHLTSDLRIPGVRWIPSVNLHVTLHFLGDVAEERVPTIIEQLNAVESRRFNLEIRDVLFFPDQRRPRILALEVAESFAASHALASLHAKTLAVVNRCLSHEPDGRPFRPHVTLARLSRFDGPARSFMLSAVRREIDA